MNRPFRLFASIALVATAMAAVAIGPPNRARAIVVGRDLLTTACVERNGSGSAVFFEGRWMCAHQVAGLFTLTPLGGQELCAALQFEAATVVMNEDGVSCE